MRRLARLVLFACLIGQPARGQQRPVAPAPRATSDTLRFATVTYISGQSLYVSAGDLDGVREGTLVEEMHGGSVVVMAKAAFLASHSSACTIVWTSSSGGPTIGDTVRYRPSVERPVLATADSGSPKPRPTSYTGYQSRPIRGRVGLRYLSVSLPAASGIASSYSQPSADIYVQGTALAGGMVGFIVDGRSRRTIGSAESQASPIDERTLIYGASLSITHRESGTRLSIGRQYSSPLSSVGLFDGVTAELNRAHWGVGLFTGAQPNAATMQFSSAVRESGGWMQLHAAPGTSMPWSVTTGAIESSDLGAFNREFGFAQFMLTNELVTVYAMQELDVNRGWKRAAGDPALSPTSTFLSLSVRPIDDLSIHAGVDNRRNVLLYRDYVNPVTTFDDAYRQGVWGGATYTIVPMFHIGVDARISRGGVAGPADSYTASFSAGPFLSRRVEARLRSTLYRTDATAGSLNAVTAGFDPVDFLHLEIDGGVRGQHVTNPLGSSAAAALASPATQSWFGGSVDVSVGRSWYASVSLTRDNVGPDPTNLLYSSLVYRF